MSEVKEVKETPLTIPEFKAWLSGVEEMQEPDWVPNETQWKRIREKIGKLCNDLNHVVAIASQSQQIPAGPIKRTTTTPQSGTVSFPEIPTPMVSAIPSQNVAMPQPSTLMGNQSRMADSVEPTIKTPNIDTSNGGYKSHFD